MPIPRKVPTTLSRFEFSSIALMILLRVAVAAPTSIGLVYALFLFIAYVPFSTIFAVNLITPVSFLPF